MRAVRVTHQQYRHSDCRLLRCTSPGTQNSWLSRSGQKLFSRENQGCETLAAMGMRCCLGCMLDPAW